MKNNRPKGIIGKGREIKNWEQALKWFRKRIAQKISNVVSGRKKDMVSRALSFSQLNKDSLVIIGDTRKDTITMAYKEKFMVTDISSKFLHLNQGVIRKTLLKQIKNPVVAKENCEEFIHIFNTLLFNFISIINKKEEVVKTEKKVVSLKTNN